MSEELTFQERCFYIQEDFTVQCEIRDFIDTIQNERLAEGLRHLTDRQRQVIELYFWKGYQCKEIATMFGCSPAAVTDLMHRVYKQLRVYLMDR
nr:MAG TPA: RNA polymerase sigma factor [Caudoviricetes sp.]